jgi:hypothetical protein
LQAVKVIHLIIVLLEKGEIRFHLPLSDKKYEYGKGKEKLRTLHYGLPIVRVETGATGKIGYENLYSAVTNECNDGKKPGE